MIPVQKMILKRHSKLFETNTFTTPQPVRILSLLFFDNNLHLITVRCATDHPQQSLYQLLALANAYADDPAIQKKTKEPRVLGAVKILEQLKKDKKLKETISQMERMCSSKFQTC